MVQVIEFPKPVPKHKKVANCAFCNKPLVKGKYMQTTETEPAICFSCIKVCNELIETTPN